MSGVPSTPSTPGRASAVTRRSSRSLRLAMAIPSPRTPRAPRAGWSAATRSRRPSVADEPARRCGRPRPARCGRARGPGSRSGRRPTAVDGSWRRHGSSAARTRRDRLAAGERAPRPRPGRASRSSTRAGRRRWPRRRWRTRGCGAGPSRSSRPWHERAAEGVAGAEAVDDLDRERRHLDALVPGGGEHALGALLDDGELDAALEQRVGRALRVGLADGDLALLAVADGDGHVLEGLADLGAAPRPGRPRTSAGSRGRGRCACAGRGPPRRRSARRGSAPATAR